MSVGWRGFGDKGDEFIVSLSLYPKCCCCAALNFNKESSYLDFYEYN